MARQESPTKTCDCGRGKIYTSPLMRKHNAVVNGKQACGECLIDSIYESVRNKK